MINFFKNILKTAGKTEMNPVFDRNEVVKLPFFEGDKIKYLKDLLKYSLVNDFLAWDVSYEEDDHNEMLFISPSYGRIVFKINIRVNVYFDGGSKIEVLAVINREDNVYLCTKEIRYANRYESYIISACKFLKFHKKAKDEKEKWNKDFSSYSEISNEVIESEVKKRQVDLDLKMAGYE